MPGKQRPAKPFAIFYCHPNFSFSSNWVARALVFTKNTLFFRVADYRNVGYAVFLSLRFSGFWYRLLTVLTVSYVAKEGGASL